MRSKAFAPKVVATFTVTLVLAAVVAWSSPLQPSAAQEPPPSCGDPVPAIGGTWDCSFVDNFDGATLDRTKWVPQTTATTGYHSGVECFVDDPDNIGVANGVLSLTVRQEPNPFACDPYGIFTTQYTSGMVSTVGKFSQTYGRFEVRASVPSTPVPGLQETFWLWPNNATKYGKWPASGEIDFAEFYSQYNDRSIPYVHYKSTLKDPNVTNTRCLLNDLGQMHTYVVEWTPATITISFDGRVCLVDSWVPSLPLVHPQPFDQPFFIALTQALGVLTNAFDPARTPLPATTQIDYVKAWSWNPVVPLPTVPTLPLPSVPDLPTSTTAPATSAPPA